MITVSIAICMLKLCKYGVYSLSCDFLAFWEVSANISETVQDRDIVTVEDLTGNHMYPIEWHQYQ